MLKKTVLIGTTLLAMTAVARAGLSWHFN